MEFKKQNSLLVFSLIFASYNQKKKQFLEFMYLTKKNSKALFLQSENFKNKLEPLTTKGNRKILLEY